MNLNDAKSVPTPRKRSFRVGRGRGSGWGKTSRRGQKGASSRTGWGGGIMREGGQMPLARRIPKKGFNNYEFRVSYEVVNVDRLAGAAKDGAITPDILKDAHLIKRSARWIKVLGNGEPGAALKVSAHHFSRGAREKIEKAGGTVTVLPGRGGRVAPASPGERHAAAAADRTAVLAKRPPREKVVPAEAPAKGPKPERAAKVPKAEGGAPAEKAAKTEKAAKSEKAPGADRPPKAPKPPKSGKPE
jgi:large subunit ribosomal protein L15